MANRKSILAIAQKYLDHKSLGHEQWSDWHMNKLITDGKFRDKDAALLFIKVERDAGNLK